MNQIDRTPDSDRHWLTIMREQGRTLTWLAQVTGKTYPQVRSYRNGTAKVPQEWLEQVYALLGEAPR